MSLTIGTSNNNLLANGSLQVGPVTVGTGSTLDLTDPSATVPAAISIDGGTLDLGTLDNTTSVNFDGNGGTLDLQGVDGNNTIPGFGFGDNLTFGGGIVPTLDPLTGTITTPDGTISLGVAPANTSYQVITNPDGTSTVALTPQTIGVYRFFEQSNGTHFFTSSQTEAAGLADPSSLSYRSDLTEETNGFGAYVQAPSDPNEVQVYRFFDTTHGTEFLTASTTEADGLMNSSSPTYRPDLTYEPNSNFYEDGTQQAGDVAVYRFFNTTTGTHFYTGSQAEYAAITTPGTSSFRPDLTNEGVGFYAPAGSYST